MFLLVSAIAQPEQEEAEEVVDYASDDFYKESDPSAWDYSQVEWERVPANQIPRVPKDKLDIIQLNANQKNQITASQLEHGNNLEKAGNLGDLNPSTVKEALANKYNNVNVEVGVGFEVSADGIADNGGVKIDLNQYGVDDQIEAIDDGWMINGVKLTGKGIDNINKQADNTFIINNDNRIILDEFQDQTITVSSTGEIVINGPARGELLIAGRPVTFTNNEGTLTASPAGFNAENAEIKSSKFTFNGRGSGTINADGSLADANLIPFDNVQTSLLIGEQTISTVNQEIGFYADESAYESADGNKIFITSTKDVTRTRAEGFVKAEDSSSIYEGTNAETVMSKESRVTTFGKDADLFSIDGPKGKLAEITKKLAIGGRFTSDPNVFIKVAEIGLVSEVINNGEYVSVNPRVDSLGEYAQFMKDNPNLNLILDREMYVQAGDEEGYFGFNTEGMARFEIPGKDPDVLEGSVNIFPPSRIQDLSGDNFLIITPRQTDTLNNFLRLSVDDLRNVNPDDLEDPSLRAYIETTFGIDADVLIQNLDNPDSDYFKSMENSFERLKRGNDNLQTVTQQIQAQFERLQALDPESITTQDQTQQLELQKQYFQAQEEIIQARINARIANGLSVNEEVRARDNVRYQAESQELAKVNIAVQERLIANDIAGAQALLRNYEQRLGDEPYQTRLSEESTLYAEALESFQRGDAEGAIRNLQNIPEGSALRLASEGIIQSQTASLIEGALEGHRETRREAFKEEVARLAAGQTVLGSDALGAILHGYESFNLFEKYGDAEELRTTISDEFMRSESARVSGWQGVRDLNREGRSLADIDNEFAGRTQGEQLQYVAENLFDGQDFFTADRATKEQIVEKTLALQAVVRSSEYSYVRKTGEGTATQNDRSAYFYERGQQLEETLAGSPRAVPYYALAAQATDDPEVRRIAESRIEDLTETKFTGFSLSTPLGFQPSQVFLDKYGDIGIAIGGDPLALVGAVGIGAKVIGVTRGAFSLEVAAAKAVGTVLSTSARAGAAATRLAIGGQRVARAEQATTALLRASGAAANKFVSSGARLATQSKTARSAAEFARAKGTQLLPFADAAAARTGIRRLATGIESGVKFLTKERKSLLTLGNERVKNARTVLAAAERSGNADDIRIATRAFEQSVESASLEGRVVNYFSARKASAAAVPTRAIATDVVRHEDDFARAFAENDFIVEGQRATYSRATQDGLEALKEIMLISSLGNEYFQKREPWKADKKHASITMNLVVNIVKDLAILMKPVLPETCDKIFKQLNIKEGDVKELGKLSIKKHKVGKAEILFNKLEDRYVATLRKKFSGKQEPELFSKLDLVVGKIESVEKHPNADKLYIEKINIGTEQRQIVSGLANHYKPNELVGKNIILVKNLKSAKLRGVESYGMLLAAEKGKELKILEAPKSKPGSVVSAEEITPNPDKEIDINLFQQIKLTTKQGRIIYKGHKLRTEHGDVVCNIEDNAEVK